MYQYQRESERMDNNNIAQLRHSVHRDHGPREYGKDMMHEVIHPRYSKNERNVKAVNKSMFLSSRIGDNNK